MKKTIAYINPICFTDTDLSVLKFLAAKYRIIWFPIVSIGNQQYSKDDIEKYAKENNIELHYLINLNRFRSIKNLSFYYSLYSIVRKIQPDCIFTCDNNVFNILFLSVHFRTKVIFGIHDVELHSNINFRPLFRILNSLSVACFKHFAVFSTNQFKIFRDKYPHKDVKMLGMSIKDYGNAKVTTPPFGSVIKLLFFGNIQYYKGLDILINSLESLYNNGVTNLELSIYGTGPFWGKCAPLLKTSRIYNLHITFIDKEDIPDIMASHHFLVLPYRDVSQSGPLMIALNYGLPIVAPRIGCFSNIYNDNSALLYMPGELSSSLVRLSKMTERDYLLLKAECKNIRNRFSNINIANNYVDYFDTI